MRLYTAAVLVAASLTAATLFQSNGPKSAPHVPAAAPEPEEPPVEWPSFDPAFEPNHGQAPGDVLFVSGIPGPDVRLTRAGARFRLPSGEGRAMDLGLELVGARRDARVRGEERRPGVSHYYKGNDRAKWRTNVPHFARVVYEDVYPGIDAAFHGHKEGVEYDFLLDPGADPASIRLRFAHGTRLAVDDAGELIIATAEGTARQRAPVAFQEIEGRRELVPVRYRVAGRREAGFELGDYDPTRKLVIDPVLVFGTYLLTFDSAGRAVAVGDAGSIYVTGFNNNFLTPSGDEDVVVLKLSATGQLLYTTHLGSWHRESGEAIVAGDFGSVWVVGTTVGEDPRRNFPRTTDAFQTEAGGATDAFFLRLGPSGELQYSSLLGGSGMDRANAITVGRFGAIIIAGSTTSPNFPLERATQASLGGGTDGFLTKFDFSGPGGGALAFSTYLGGSGDDVVHDLAYIFDTDQTVAVGETRSSDFPGTVATTYRGALDGFVTHFGGFSGLGSTYIGGSGDDRVLGVALDGLTPTGVYVTGVTTSTDFPTSNAFKPAFTGPGVEGFLARLGGRDGGQFSTYVGRNGGGDVAYDSVQNAVYLTGLGRLEISNMALPPDLIPWVTASKLTASFTDGNPSITGIDWSFGQTGMSEIAAYNNEAVVAGTGLGASFPTYNQTASSQPECAECDFAIILAKISGAPQPTLQHEQDDPAVTYTGAWTTLADASASGGTLSHSSEAGATVTIEFTGTGIQIFGRRAPTGSILRSEGYPDLRPAPPQADLYSDPPQPRALLLSVTGFPHGTHRFTLTNLPNTARPGTDVWFDGFNILTGGPQPTATPPPSRPTWAPTVTPRPWPTLTPTPGPTAIPTATPSSGIARIEDTDARVVYAGSWFTKVNGNHSASSAHLAMDAGRTATLSFEGSGIRWIGHKDPWSGIARVYVDGTLAATVDTYSATSRSQTVLYETTVAPGAHTLRIEVTQTRNAASGGFWIWVDAFDVVPLSGPPATPTPTPRVAPTVTPTPLPPGVAVRIEQSDPRVLLAGEWHHNVKPVHSGGSASLSPGAAFARLDFNGTGVRWIGLRDPWSGIARVFIDGTLHSTVDTYSATQQRQTPVFSIAGLPAGAHTIRVEVTGTRNAASGGNWVWVDAFDITP